MMRLRSICGGRGAATGTSWAGVGAGAAAGAEAGAEGSCAKAGAEIKKTIAAASRSIEQIDDEFIDCGERLAILMPVHAA